MAQGYFFYYFICIYCNNNNKVGKNKQTNKLTVEGRKKGILGIHGSWNCSMG